MMTTLAVLVVLAMLVGGVLAQAHPPRCPPPLAPAPADCIFNWNGDTEYEFTVQGKYFGIEYVDGRYIRLRCGKKGPSLEGGALPVFGTQLVVGDVTVDRCAPAVYAAVLRDMNVTLAPTFNLTLAGPWPGQVALAPAHLARLVGVRALKLYKAGVPRGSLLATMPDLVELTVTQTRLQAGELGAPPPRLELVSLMEAGVGEVPAALLALPSLRSLTVSLPGGAPVHVPATPSSHLQRLAVSGAEEALLAQWAPPALTGAHLGQWQAEAPPPLPALPSLGYLTLVSPAMRRLPPGWLAGCPRLATLEVRFATALTSLPPGLLSNASSLTWLVLRGGSLSHLPADLFSDTPHLAHLDLSGNHLKELPSGAMVQVSDSLLELDLSNNELTSQVGAALVTLSRLRNLSLAHNIHLLDLCKSDQDSYVTVNKNRSPLSSLKHLETLNLKNTSVTAICTDWRTDLQHLAVLDLRYTHIATLTYKELVEYRREVPTAVGAAAVAVVKLEGASLRDLNFTPEEYDEAVRRRPRAFNVTLELGGTLVCDCYLYWFARALEEGLLPVGGAGGGLRCAGGGRGGGFVLGREVRADRLACAPPAGACPVPLPRGCSCTAGGERRGDDPGALLQLRCESAGLAHLPRLPPAASRPALVAALDLVLANNSITTITAGDIPPNLRTLDLRNNSIERIEEATALALVGGAEGGRGSRRVQLAGNPLECTCRTVGARRVLRAHRRVFEGYEEGAVRCRDGRALAAVPEVECEPPAAALGASLAGLGLVTALALGAVAGRRGALRRLKAVLRGLRLGSGAEGGDLALPYDVFVTFGRGDETAALETAARLERGGGGGGSVRGGGRRVLLQERDWLPPAWVPHCVEVSIALSRRTVALVSAPWERGLESAEVRAAYEDAWRGRLVLVLPPAAPAPAPCYSFSDSALRRYARDYPHLVLRRDHAHYWRDLDRALPPRPPPPQSSQVRARTQ